MNSVYIVHHEHDLEDYVDTKVIGVYRTRESAEGAIERLSKAEGFKDNIDGFSISKYELDKDHWIEGFITYYWNDEDEDT